MILMPADHGPESWINNWILQGWVVTSLLHIRGMISSEPRALEPRLMTRHLDNFTLMIDNWILQGWVYHVTTAQAKRDPPEPRTLELQLIGPGFRSHEGIYFARVLSKSRTTTTMATPLTDQPELDQNTTDVAMRRQISALQEEVANLRHPPRQMMWALEVSIVQWLTFVTETVLYGPGVAFEDLYHSPLKSRTSWMNLIDVSVLRTMKTQLTLRSMSTSDDWESCSDNSFKTGSLDWCIRWIDALLPFLAEGIWISVRRSSTCNYLRRRKFLEYAILPIRAAIPYSWIKVLIKLVRKTRAASRRGF